MFALREYSFNFAWYFISLRIERIDLRSVRVRFTSVLKKYSHANALDFFLLNTVDLFRSNRIKIMRSSNRISPQLLFRCPPYNYYFFLIRVFNRSVTSEYYRCENCTRNLFVIGTVYFCAGAFCLKFLRWAGEDKKKSASIINRHTSFAPWLVVGGKSER